MWLISHWNHQVHDWENGLKIDKINSQTEICFAIFQVVLVQYWEKDIILTDTLIKAPRQLEEAHQRPENLPQDNQVSLTGWLKRARTFVRVDMCTE